MKWKWYERKYCVMKKLVYIVEWLECVLWTIKNLVSIQKLLSKGSLTFYIHKQGWYTVLIRYQKPYNVYRTKIMVLENIHRYRIEIFGIPNFSIPKFSVHIAYWLYRNFTVYQNLGTVSVYTVLYQKPYIFLNL